MMGLSRVHTLSFWCVLFGCSDSSKDVETCEEGVYFADEDGDGFGSPYVSTKACEIPNGFVANNTDCDDFDSTQFPNQVWFVDVDGDGFGDGETSIIGCVQPIGYVHNSDDCDDRDSSRNPDQDWYHDQDGDGYGNADLPIPSCDVNVLELAASDGTDCNDLDALIHPMANEVCDFLDNNCSGMTDNDDPLIDVYTQVPFFQDLDGDGYGSTEYIGHFCPSFSEGSMNNDDCDDTNIMVNPAQVEMYDEVDQNCDGDGLWHNAEDIQFGFSHANSGSQFGIQLDAFDIEGDSLTDLVISQPIFTWNEQTETNDGKVIWVSGTQEPDFTDLSQQLPFWYGEPDDALYGIWAGDMDGDGVADILMGSRNKNEKEGAVYLVSSDANSGLVTEKALWSWTIPDQDYRVGSSLLRIGDVDADGLDDVVMGASHFDNGYNSRGGAFLLRGSDVGVQSDPSTGSWIAGSSNGDQFGLHISRAGDVDGDGIEDILASSIYADQGGTSSGSVYLFPVTDVLAGTVVPEDMVQFYGEVESDKAGTALADVGDVNGDGYDDFLIGSKDHDEVYDNDGAAYLIHGQPYNDFDLLNSLSNADATFIGSTQNDGFAYDIEGVGDVDGDGLDDFVIGSYLADPTGSNHGLVIGFFGGQHSGRHNADDVSDFMIRGNANNTRLGRGIARAGDQNGDGLDDVWLGAYGYDSYRGRIYLLHGFAHQ